MAKRSLFITVFNSVLWRRVLKNPLQFMANRLIDLYQLDQIYIVCGRTNLRDGIDELATLIQ